MAATRLLAVGVAVAGALVLAQTHRRSDKPRASALPGGTGLSKAQPSDLQRRGPLPDVAPVRYNGLAWQIHHVHDVVERAGEVFRQIAELGADTVLISNAGYQEHARSASFKIDPEVTPSPGQWQKIFVEAHRHNLRVILMPIILLSDPRGDEWRGRINPPDWDEWFAQYRHFLKHFAGIAEKGRVEVGNVEAMTVGSELISTERFTRRWRDLIADVRRVYKGRLCYSANWDHYKVVEFWDALDLVGMTSYYKLANEPGPTLEHLVREWEPLKAGIVEWVEKIGRPILFTEVGWCSQVGASIEPWNYYHDQRATAAGLEEQRRNYLAFMKTWEDTPQVQGIIWWEWTEAPGGPDDFNYTPRGKPAGRELAAFLQRQRRRAAQAGRAGTSSQPAPTPVAGG